MSLDQAIDGIPVQTTDAAIARVEDQFSVMHRHMKAGMRRRASRVHPDLAVLGYMILSTIQKCGPTHAGALAERLDIDKGLLSRQLRALEELGLLARESDPTDKRAAFISLSPEGVERVAAVRAADRAVLYDQLRDWEVDDLEKLAELLSRVNAIDA
ncbi:MarR family winged helix-turn-helix transcriptional regulator [Parafrigoribacterium soli]|uniref:MarR family winged helix-turn-helix transcriptional regulator n=1 Tax=Parafrigoribacterium soli TaxID=3144663 RepID=UPI0032F09477